MMTDQTLTLEQIRIAGLRALERELGPVNTIRFLQMYSVGSGDYTTERHEWLDNLTLDEIREASRKCGSNVTRSRMIEAMINVLIGVIPIL